MTAFRSLLIWLLVAVPVTARAETILVMAEEAGCYWCARWNEEIGPIYPKTAEGRTAPLVRYDLFADAPQGVTFATRVQYTPTFILVQDGVEVSRIEGYPGQDFFWGLLGMMFRKAHIETGAAG